MVISLVKYLISIIAKSLVFQIPYLIHFLGDNIYDRFLIFVLVGMLIFRQNGNQQNIRVTS